MQTPPAALPVALAISVDPRPLVFLPAAANLVSVRVETGEVE